MALQNGNVAMYDLIDRQFVFALRVGGTPYFVITGLYPPTVDVTPTPSPGILSSPYGQVLQNGAIIILVIALLIMALFLGVLLAVLRTRRNENGRS